MPDANAQTSRGGRCCPPLSLEGRIVCALRLVFVLSALLAAFFGTPASGQFQPAPEGRKPQPIRRTAGGGPNAARVRQARARQLLRMMLKPKQQYIGVQETHLYEGTGLISEQEIEGDTNGSIKVLFRSPANVRGDMMIITPGIFRSYHSSARLLEVAPWPTEYNDESNRMFANLLNGTVTASVTGNEIVADRQADIVELKVPNGAAGAGRVLRRLWIDDETGILLKIQKLNALGHTTSTTTMETITVNPANAINPNEFKPQFPGATITPLFPAPQYRTMEDAQGHLPFTPIEPAPQALPANFHLDGVWGFGEDRAHPYLHSVLMRFTDGVASFSLYERLVPPAKQTPIEAPLRRTFGRNQQTWRIQTQQGVMSVQYIGHLLPEQTAAIYQSLR